MDMSGTGYKIVNKTDKISAFPGRGEDTQNSEFQVRILACGQEQGGEQREEGMGSVCKVWSGKAHWNREVKPDSGGMGRQE